MDNTINSIIIEKVTIKSVAIYKAIGMLPQPQFEDKFKKETLCQQNENTQKQNLENNLNEPEKRIEQPQNVDTKETKIVKEQESLNTTTQIKSGIYKIVNKVNGKYYVGSSTNIKIRWKNHIKELNKNRHKNPHLQSAWNKYGMDNFEFNIVELCSLEDLINIEQKYLNIAHQNKETNYNIGIFAENSFRGRKHTNETKEIIGLKSKNRNVGRIVSIEERVKLRQIKLKEYSDPNNRKKMSDVIKKVITRKKETGCYKPVLRDTTIRHFYNSITKEEFVGIRYDFIKMYNVSAKMYRKMLQNGITRSGWKIIYSLL
jgi:group I intron endonuclease